MTKASIRDLSKQHGDRLCEAFGSSLTPATEAACRRAGDMLAISETFRGRVLDGETANVGQLLQLEEAANAAVASLNLPAPKPPAPNAMRITFVSDIDMKVQHLLEDFDANLRRLLEQQPPPVVGDVNDVLRLAESAVVHELANEATSLDAQLEQAKKAMEEAERELQRTRAEMAPPLELTAVESNAGHREASAAPAPTTLTSKGEHSDAYGMFAALNSHLSR
jgi:hypothetical protein